MEARYRSFLGIIVAVLYVSIHAVHAGHWNTVYKKIFTQSERVHRIGSCSMIISRSNTMPFSQLIFSWNGLKPKMGYYVFWVQVRDRKTHSWGNWHKMIEWGAMRQRSYAHFGNDVFSAYHHVRLEVDPSRLADAYRIKIVAHEGADLSLLYSYCVNLADFNKFTPEDIVELASHLKKSIHLVGISKEAQFSVDHKDNRRICSPTCCAILTKYLAGTHIDPAYMADEVYDEGLGSYGAWQFNTAALFHYNKQRACFFVIRPNSFYELYQQLKRGIPVIVSVRGSIDGAPQEYPSGHLILIVGYDTDTQSVICHDSATHDVKTVLKYYPLESFVRAWENSRRLTYWVDLLKEGAT